MVKLTASNIVHAINALPRNLGYNYINPRNGGRIEVVECVAPEGPIRIIRNGTPETMSVQMIWRYANAFVPAVPINIDRVLGASYNTRSALEALLAHTPHFFWCSPGRIEFTLNNSAIKKGHKHLVWLPDRTHASAQLAKYDLGDNQAISELPSQAIVYESLALTDFTPPDHELTVDVKRRHLQIQIALLEIGHKIGFKTWIAHNDKGFRYGDRRVGELEGVIPSLSDETVLQAYPAARTAANLIDCIWFKNGRLMPAVLEVEQSTGISSGLNRMMRFKQLGPALTGIRWVIVASDKDREKVITKANEPQFLMLNTRFFSYSAVEELHSLCTRRGLNSSAVNENLLDCFMERCVL